MLHYFVLARSRGHRHAFFLRLSSIPSASKGSNVLVQNLLEITFCRAFESLLVNVVTEFCGPGDYSNAGLNNLPPLFQGERVSVPVRAELAEYLRHSPDPEPLTVQSGKKFDTDKLRGIRDTFGLAAAISDEKIRCTYWESTCFYASLLSQARLEKEGLVNPLSSTDLAPVFRDWLSYKHFTDCDIKNLEQTVGGLTLGLLQISTILANRTRDKVGREGPVYRGYQGKHDGLAFENVKQIFYRVSGIISNPEMHEEMKSSIEGQSNAGEIFPDSSTMDFMNGMITESAVYAPEREDKGYAELRLYASQRWTPHQHILKESPVFRAKLRDMLTEAGLERKIDKDTKTYGEYWALRVCRNLFTPDTTRTRFHV